MSVVNIFAFEKHIICQTDTGQYNQSGQMLNFVDTKADIHGNFVVAARGNSGAINAVNRLLHGKSNVDEAKPIVDYAHKLIANYKIKSGRDDAVNIETFVIGWSDQARDMVVRRWRLHKEGTEVSYTTLPRGMHLNPLISLPLPSLPEDLTDDQVMRIALAQYSRAKTGDENAPVGGVIHSTRIDKHGATQRVIGVYPGYFDDAEKYGCPHLPYVRTNFKLTRNQ